MSRSALALSALVGVALTASGCASDTPIVKNVPFVRGMLLAPPFPHGWRVADLTLPLDATSPHVLHPRQFPFERMDLPPSEPGDPHTGAFTAMEHSGTHLAAPRTRRESGDTLDAFHDGDLLLPLVVIDVPSDAATEATIGDDVIRSEEREHGTIPKDAVVVLRTRAGPRSEIHPGWGPSAVKWLIKDRGVRVVGTDATSLSSTSAARDPAQQTTASNGAFSLVGLHGLDSIPARGAWVVIGALPILGAAGAPARVVALVPPDSPEVDAPVTPSVGPQDAPTVAPARP
ncbi:MAG: cyclase family protein [Planctomycetes bacterium]|nr:cyclase family protein [Planctomycetota bacterium]